jgi:hypothetical protein
MANNAISETELRQRVLSTNKALSSTLLLLQSQNRALSFAISRMESRLKKKKRQQQNAELAATADSAGSR